MRASTLLAMGALACGPAEQPAPEELRQETTDETVQEPYADENDHGLDLSGMPIGRKKVALKGDGAIHPFFEAEKVKNDETDWGPELVWDQVLPSLNVVKRVLTGEDGLRDLEKVVAPGAALVMPAAPAGPGRPLTLGVAERSWDSAVGAALPPAEWVAGLERYQAGFARLRYAVLKAKRVDLEDDKEHARLTLKYRVNGVTPTGGVRHDTGLWTSDWVLLRDEGASWHCPRCGLTSQQPGEHCKGPLEAGSGPGRWALLTFRPSDDMKTVESDAPHFVDITAAALAGTDVDPRLPEPPLPRPVRPAVAIHDLDGDRDPDVVITKPTRLLINRGDGTFEDGTERLGLGPGETTHTAVLIVDFNRDGHVDILLGRYPTSRVLLGRGDGTFERRNFQLQDPGMSKRWVISSMTAHDVDRDGLMDVFIGGHGLDGDPGPNSPTDADNGFPNRMFKGLPDAQFQDVTEDWGLDAEGTRWCLAASFHDFDGDGDNDLYVANDFGRNVIYRRSGSPGEPVFTAEVEDPSTASTGFSMSSTFADLDGDLDLDMYVTNMSSTAARRILEQPGAPEPGTELWRQYRMLSRGNSIMRNVDGRLVEAPEEDGAVLANWAWGTSVFDYDCDGDLDIACVNGFLTTGEDDGKDL